MGFWDFFRKKEAPPAAPEDDEARAAQREVDALAPTSPAARASEERDRANDPATSARPAALAALEDALRAGDGPRAAAQLQALRGTRDEAEALGLALARERALDEAGRTLAPAMFLERGEPGSAEALLADATSPAGHLLAADALTERGDLASALGRVERALLASWDYPGARERHARLRAQLGWADAPRAEARPAGTMLTATPEAPYKLLREVARGGAGAVYEAEEIRLGRKVAMKVYHAPERDRDQLLHEARVACQFAGPHVLRVYDVEAAAGWVALEWCPRGAIRDRLRAKDVAPLLPLHGWLLPLAEALAQVHAAGWVHLDVKPANVLLPDGPGVRLADFGIARPAGEKSPGGSLGYVRPERARGAPASPRDDLYGLGRLLEDVLAATGDAPLRRAAQPLLGRLLGREEPFADGAAVVEALRGGLLP